MSGAGINEIIKEVHEGDRSSAAEWNKMAAEVNRLSQMQKGTPGIYTGCGAFTYPKRQQPLVIYNGGGESATIPAYGVVIRDGIRTTLATYFPTVKRATAYGCQENFFINDAVPIAANAYGEAQQSFQNLYIVAYDQTTGTPAKGDMWGVKSGSYKLCKDYGGFICEGFANGSNLMYARSAPMYTVRGKPTADVASGASGTLTIYVGAYGSETQPSGNPTITNVRNDSSCTITGSQIARARINPDINISGNPWQFMDGRTS